jgi:serine/threonine protein kinase
MVTSIPFAKPLTSSQTAKAKRSRGGSSSLSSWQRQPQQRTCNTGPHLLHKICSGSAGDVMAGVYNGIPAVIKLLGPDSAGLEAFDREARSYSVLHQEQGEVVPQLLGVGWYPLAGVRYLAVRRIQGSPLSGLPTIPPSVAAAAVRALERVHRAGGPGFLHGDVRLQNILLEEAAASSDANPRCFIIDFGRASEGGSVAQQRQEVRELKALLARRSAPCG